MRNRFPQDLAAIIEREGAEAVLLEVVNFMAAYAARCTDAGERHEAEGGADTLRRAVASIFSGAPGEVLRDGGPRLYDAFNAQGRLVRVTVPPNDPRCARCETPFDHGCNSAFCSQACEDLAEAEVQAQDDAHAAGAHAAQPSARCAACRMVTPALRLEDAQRQVGR